MKQILFHPGCTLSLYKPELAEKAYAYTQTQLPVDAYAPACCRHEPPFTEQTQLVTVCAGCYHRLRAYPHTDTLSFWDVVDGDSNFPFPDYNGMTLTIHDPCLARTYPHIHESIRSLLGKMNIRIVEDEYHRERSKCCGDRMLKTMSIEDVDAYRVKRMGEMPCDEIAVYCASCIEAINTGQKRPQYVLDLLFGEPTTPLAYGTQRWKDVSKQYIVDHPWE